MALQGTDLFVVQSQADGVLYKLRLDQLITEVEAGAGVTFKGKVDLNNPPINSGVTLPAANGDFYLVESDAAAIDSGWVMQGGETSASAGDRVIYDGDDNNWILITTGSGEAGTVQDITASYPLESDGDKINPVLSIQNARTTTAANNSGDGLGTRGAVARLAEESDVAHTTGSGASDAVVTADLLKATNEIVEGLALAAGGVQTVTSTNANGNSALSIAPTSGNVVIEIATASTSNYGVVELASTGDITNGVAGPSAVVDAAALKDVIDSIDALETGVSSVSTRNVNSNSALTITPTEGDVLVEINTASLNAYGVVQIANNTDLANGTAGAGAVVDAAALKDVVDSIEALDTGVSSVSTANANGNAALTITPTEGDVLVEINNAATNAYGVVQLADATDIANGTSGASAVIDAAALKDVIDNLPQEGIQSITEGGTNIEEDALQITTDGDGNTTIGINEEVFCPYDFASLTDITTV